MGVTFLTTAELKFVILKIKENQQQSIVESGGCP